MSRVQLALNVTNVDAAVSFYDKLFATSAAQRRPGYAIRTETWVIDPDGAPWEWVTDPDGAPWDWYVKTGDAERMASGPSGSGGACCAPDNHGAPDTHG